MRKPFSNIIIHPFLILIMIIGVLHSGNAYAVSYTWDGGGATNNWSECANWTSDTCPGNSDTAVFDATSTKNAVIDGSFAGTINSLDVNSGYTGTITQDRTLTVVGATFDIGSGIYTSGTSGDIDFSADATLTVAASATFTHSTGTISFTGNFNNAVNLSGSQEINNLTINKSTTYDLSIPDGDTLIVNGVTTLTNGELAGTGFLETRGAVNVASTFDGGAGTASGKWRIGGTGSDAITVASGAYLPILVVNNSNATLNYTGSNTSNLDGDLTVSAGTFNCGTNGMTLNAKSIAVSGGTFNSGDCTINIAGTGDFAISAGTFHGQTATITLEDPLVISGGTLDLGSSNFSINAGQNWTHTAGGTFTADSSTVSFTGSYTSTIDIDTGATTNAGVFFNLVINKSSNNDVEVSAGDTVIVNGLTTLTDGELTGTGFLETRGTVNVASTFDGGAGTASGKWRIGGTGSDAITVSSGAYLPILVLNNSNATLNFTGSGISGLDGDFTLSAGTFNCGTNGMTLNAKSIAVSGGTFNSGDCTINIAGTGDFAISVGAFNGQTATITLTDPVVISGGTLDLGSSSFTIDGNNNWTHTAGGTFTAGTSTVIYTGSFAPVIDIDTGSTTNAGVFYNFNLNKDGSTGLVINTGDTVIANGTTNFIGGQLAGSGTFETRGNVNVSSTFNGGNNATTGLWKVGGSSVNAISIDGNATIPNFTLNNANATVSISGAGTLLGDGNVSIQNGIFNMGSNSVTFDLNASFSISGGTFNAGNSSIDISGANDFAISGGTFNADTANITIHDNYAQTGGTINLDSSTFTINGDNDFTHTTGGTFNAGTSTFQFTGSYGIAWDIDTVGTVNAGRFYNLVMNKNSGVTTNTGDVFLVMNDFTWTDGYINSPAKIDIKGNLSTSSLMDASTVNLEFSGTSDQTIDLTGVTGNLNGDIDVYKSSGKLILQSAMVLDVNNQDLVVKSGTLDLNGYDLTVDSGGNSTTFVINDGGILELRGYETITTDSGYPQFDSGSTTIYDGNGTYSVNSYSYHHLTISGGSTSEFNLSTSQTVSGNLIINSGTLDAAGNDLTVSGSFSNAATLKLQGSETVSLTNDSNSGTVLYVGDNDGAADSYYINDWTYNNLTINFSDTSDSTKVTDSTANTLNNNLIAYLKLDDGTGQSTAADDTGNSNTGTLTNMDTSTDWVSGSSSITFSNTNALDFDGTDDYVVLNGSIYDNTFDTRTVSLWFKADDSSSTQVIYDEGGASNGMNIYLRNGYIYGGAWVGVSTWFVQGDSTIATNQWYHVALVYNKDSNLELFVDGSSQGTQAIGGTQMASHSAGDTLGAAISGTQLDNGDTSDGHYFNGQIDDYRVYSAVLTTSQITTLSQGKNSDSQNLNLSTLDVNGKLDIQSGSFTSPPLLKVAGDFSAITGGFANNSGTVMLDGADQTITGNITFYDLVKATPNAAVLTLPAGQTITISNDSTLEGTSGNLLSLRSSSSGTQVNFNPQGNRGYRYLDIKDNKNTNATDISCTVGCVDSGNNVKWALSLPDVSFASSSASHSEGVANFYIPVILSKTSGSNVTVDYSVSGGTATGSGTDYTLASGTLTINAGSTNGNIAVSIANDSLDEPNETVIVNLSNPSNSNLGGITSFTLTITDNDASPTVTVNDVVVNENVGNAVVTVSLSGQSSNVISVDYSTTVSSTATSGVDFTASSGTLTWSSEATGSKIFNIPITNDLLDEDTETIDYILSNPVNVVIADGTGTVTLNDDDNPPTVSLSINTNSLAENAGVNTLTATLSTTSAKNVTVNLAYSGTATAGTDYSKFDSIVINAGTISNTATITATNDNKDEDNESINVDISSVVNGSENGTQQVTTSLVDDDTSGFSITQSGGSTSMTEGGTTDTLAIKLNSEPYDNVTMSLTTDSDSTSDQSVLVFTSANWNTIQTVTLTAIDDSLYEGNHNSTVQFTVVSASDTNYNNMSISNLVASIVDNDSPGVSVNASGGDTQISEDGTTDTYQIVLTSEPFDDVTVALSTNQANQATVSSSSVTFTSANWSTPQTITVAAVNDSRAEGNHSIKIIHTASSDGDADYDGISINQLNVAISDNDSAGVSISQTSGSTTVTESGNGDTYTVALTSKPSANVVISVSTGSDQISVIPSTLTFTPSNWDQLQTVSVSAIDDELVESSLSATISHQSVSLDSQYNGVSIANVTVSIADDDVSSETDDGTDNDTDENSGDGNDSEGTEEAGSSGSNSGELDISVALQASPSTVKEQKQVYLSATLSGEDKNSGVINWSQVSGSTVTLSGSNGPQVYFTAPKYNSTSTSKNKLKFKASITVSGSVVTSTEITVSVVRSEIVLSSREADNTSTTVSGQAVAIQEDGTIVTEKTEVLNGVESDFLEIGNRKVFYDKTEMGKPKVISYDDITILAFPFANEYKGMLLAIDFSKINTIVNLGSDDFFTLPGVKVRNGTVPKGLLGLKLLKSDVDNDYVDELIVLEPGYQYGRILILNPNTLEVIQKIVGTVFSPTNNQQIVLGNINGAGGKELIFGIGSSVSANVTASVSDEVLDENNLFYAFSLTENDSFNIDLGSDDPDFTIEIGSTVSSTAIGDVNGDNVDDMIVSMNDDCGVVVGIVFGSADIESVTSIDQTIGCFDDVSSLEVGDVTGDGIAEVIVGSSDSNDGKGNIFVFTGRNDWEGVNVDEAITISGESNNSTIGGTVILGDTDKDGILDIVTTQGESSSTVITLVNNNEENSVNSGSNALGAGGFGCQLDSAHQNKSSAMFWLAFGVCAFLFIVRKRTKRTGNI